MPASDLGVWVVLAQGRAVVTWVAEASVAAEDGKVRTKTKHILFFAINNNKCI